MDMFDLFREPDAEETQPTPNDSPPIQSSTNESETEIIRPRSNESFSSTLPPVSRVSLQNALVIGIPGSLVFRKNAFQLSWLTNLAQCVEKLRSKGAAIAIVVGESSDVRAAAHAARQFGVSHSEIESATQSSSRLHAALVLRMLAQAHPSVCQTLEETLSLLQEGKIPVMLGSMSAQSTEARAAMLAESVNGKLVLFTDLDIPTNTFTHARFSRMAGDAAFRSNQQFIVDPLAAMVLARSRIETYLLAEKNVTKLDGVLSGGESVGTRITTSENMPRKSIARGEIQRDMSEFEPTEAEIPPFSKPIPKEDDDIPASPDHIARHLG